MTFARDLANFADISANNLTFRNLIINGAMQVAQRNTSVASITTTGYRTVDRFNLDLNTLGTWTMSQENDAPTGSGFRKSAKVLCTTADASPAADDYFAFGQIIEGQNLQSIAKGTSSAKQLTLSFWVKANVTGTYIANFYDLDNNREISKSYTISTSGVWEYKTITIPADATGAFDNDNNGSLIVNFFLAVGSNRSSGTLNSSAWNTANNANRAVGQTNLASATNNYWQITGVQLEVGSSVSPFEFKPYAQDLAECQRYYIQSLDNLVASGVCYSSTEASVRFSFPVTMRAVPTVTLYDNALNAGRIHRNQVGDHGNSASAVNIRPDGFPTVSSTSLTTGGGYSARFKAEIEL